MKRHTFIERFGFAWAGLWLAARTERNFQIEIAIAAGVAVALAVVRPAAIWWALAALSGGLVLAAELFNTALEILADRLHPDTHPKIGAAKDVAAAAVLIACCAALGTAAAFVISRMG